MDSNSEDEEKHDVGHALYYDASEYRVSYAQGRKTNEVSYVKHDEFNKKSHAGKNPGRVKRVVSCKRKTHYLTVTRRKQLESGGTCDAANKENERKYLRVTQQEKLFLDPLEFSLNVNNNPTTSRTGSEQEDGLLSELIKDHNTMTDVLFERNLRLKVALTLWQRNVEELLTYFLRIQDIGVIVDFLPVISKCIDEDPTKITIGCCVDLFPLVRKVLSSPYEEYIIIGLRWIYSVLKNWWEELRASGYSRSTQPVLDENFQVFNQQLRELWQQVPLLKCVPGTADMAQVIDSFLVQLDRHQ